ncbi:uncharacterized protein LOC123258257 [Drosophila ananassae]|uniref:uncharacterized protein LOC123258257 n=1 Tax=Drosophila ananassae TaxID=7217 RepID=UPI001CFFEBF4|nr:uncharacterized protein LOC123258257 [Drosophila ananassae]
MIVNGRDYELLRRLKALTDDVALKTPDLLALARKTAKERISQCHEANAKVYNLRSRAVKLKEGDTIYARSFAQSNAAKKFSSKLAPVFVKAKIKKKISPIYYELVSDTEKQLGVYHLKDIKT